MKKKFLLLSVLPIIALSAITLIKDGSETAKETPKANTYSVDNFVDQNWKKQEKFKLPDWTVEVMAHPDELLNAGKDSFEKIDHMVHKNKLKPFTNDNLKDVSKKWKFLVFAQAETGSNKRNGVYEYLRAVKETLGDNIEVWFMRLNRPSFETNYTTQHFYGRCGYLTTRCLDRYFAVGRVEQDYASLYRYLNYLCPTQFKEIDEPALLALAVDPDLNIHAKMFCDLEDKRLQPSGHVMRVVATFAKKLGLEEQVDLKALKDKRLTVPLADRLRLNWMEKSKKDLERMVDNLKG